MLLTWWQAVNKPHEGGKGDRLPLLNTGVASEPSSRLHFQVYILALVTSLPCFNNVFKCEPLGNTVVHYSRNLQKKGQNAVMAISYPFHAMSIKCCTTDWKAIIIVKKAFSAHIIQILAWACHLSSI